MSTGLIVALSIFGYFAIGALASGFARSDTEDDEKDIGLVLGAFFAWPLALCIYPIVIISDASKSFFDWRKKKSLKKVRAKVDDLKKVRVELEQAKSDRQEQEKIIAELEAELKEDSSHARNQK